MAEPATDREGTPPPTAILALLVLTAVVGVAVSFASWGFLELVHQIQVGVFTDLPRELGFDEGVAVEVLHRAGLRGGPIACRIGRMTVAIRRAVAAAVHVAPAAA